MSGSIFGGIVVFIFLVGISSEALAKPTKVTICHNGQTLTISEDSAKKHLLNHASDFLGECEQEIYGVDKHTKRMIEIFEPCDFEDFMIRTEEGQNVTITSDLSEINRVCDSNIDTAFNLVAVSGTLEEGFSFRSNLDFEPGTPDEVLATFLGKALIRGLRANLDIKSPGWREFNSGLEFQDLSQIPGGNPSTAPPPNAIAWQTHNPFIELPSGHIDGPFALPGHGSTLNLPERNPSLLAWSSAETGCPWFHLHGPFENHVDPLSTGCGHGGLAWGFGEGRNPVNPAMVPTGVMNDANIYSVYLIDRRQAIKALLNEPRFLSMTPDLAKVDVEAEETSDDLRALIRQGIEEDDSLQDPKNREFATLLTVVSTWDSCHFVPSPILYTKEDGTRVTDFPNSLAAFAGVEDQLRIDDPDAYNTAVEFAIRQAVEETADCDKK